MFNPSSANRNYAVLNQRSQEEVDSSSDRDDHDDGDDDKSLLLNSHLVRNGGSQQGACRNTGSWHINNPLDHRDRGADNCSSSGDARCTVIVENQQLMTPGSTENPSEQKSTSSQISTVC